MSGPDPDGPPAAAAFTRPGQSSEIPGPVFVRWFGAFFVLVCIAVVVGGFIVTGGVRRQAAVTDNAIRTVAWNLLRWSAAHEGTFPRSETEFLDGMRHAVDPPAPPAPAPGATPYWPTDEKTALLGHRPALLPDALAAVTIQWATRPDVAPELSPGGKPMLPGTGDAIRGWFHRWVDEQNRRRQETQKSSPPL